MALIILAVSQINGFSSFAFNPPVAEPDIDRDGGVDGSDLARLIKAYGSDQGDLNFDPLCDLVIDLKVDELDLEAWAPYFGNTGAWAAPYPIDVAGGVVFVTGNTALAPMSERDITHARLQQTRAGRKSCTRSLLHTTAR